MKRHILLAIMFGSASHLFSAVITIKNGLNQLITVTVYGKDLWVQRLSLSASGEQVIDSGSDTPIYGIEWSYTLLERKNGHEIMHRYTWHIKTDISSSSNNILSKNTLQILPHGKYHLKKLDTAILIDHQTIDLGKPFTGKLPKKIQGIIDEQDNKDK